MGDFSKRFFSIVRRYLTKPHHEIWQELNGNTVLELELEKKPTSSSTRRSASRFPSDLRPTRVIAKLASKWKKPSGLTAIQARDIHLYLKDLPVEKVWGIGPQTSAYLQKCGMRTALDFARRNEAWVTKYPAWL